MCVGSFEYCQIDNNFFDRDSFLDFGTNDSDAKKWARDVYGVWSRSYPEFLSNFKRADEYWSVPDPLSYYCGNVYDALNSACRSYITLTPLYDCLMKDINSIIENVPKIPENIVVYRAVHSVKFLKFENLFRSGKLFIERGFMSTSLAASILDKVGPDPSSDFSTCPNVFKIFVPQGSKAVYIDDLWQEDSRDELELLFPTGAKMKLLTKRSLVNEKTLYEWQLLL